MKSKKNKEKIVKKVQSWQTKLGLINWDIAVRFAATKFNDETENFKGIACTDTKPNYKMATITFEPRLLGLVNEGVIIHELLHCFLSEINGYANSNIDKKQHDKMDQWLGYFEEQLVSELERVIVRLYKRSKIAS